MGFPTYGDGPFERIGIPTSVPLLAGFVGVCATELVVGSMLWARKPGARRLSVGLLPILAFALTFVIGPFALLPIVIFMLITLVPIEALPPGGQESAAISSEGSLPHGEV